MPNPVPGGLWDIITVDLITQLPESDGFDAICVIVNRLVEAGWQAADYNS